MVCMLSNRKDYMENKEFKELEISEELLHAIEDMGFTHMTPKLFLVQKNYNNYLLL